MSILIKGMSMPKNCVSCPFFEVVSCEEDSKDYRCARTSLYVFPKEKSIYCPLVEVKPHGRLIDADALHIDLMDRGIADIQTNDWYEIRQAVDDAPTIIESEGEDEKEM